MVKQSKLISFIGAPCSGKSTLAYSIQKELKLGGYNSIFINEAATDYIAEYGTPTHPEDQMVIFYKQLNREKMYVGSKDFIICDSSSMLNYFYFRSLFGSKLTNKNIALINHVQKEILKSINSWDMVFYLPPIDDNNTKDNIRFHNRDEITKIDRWIKSYLEMENIDHVDMTDIKLEDRLSRALKYVLS